MERRMFLVIVTITNAAISVSSMSSGSSYLTNGCRRYWNSAPCQQLQTSGVPDAASHFQHDSSSDDITTMTHCCMMTWIHAVTDVIQYLQWKDVLLLFDDTLCLKQERELRTVLALHQIGTVTLHVNHLRHDMLSSAVDTMQGTTLSSVIACLSSTTVHALLSHLNERRGSPHQYQWILSCPWSDPLPSSSFTQLDRHVVVLQPFPWQLPDPNLTSQTGQGVGVQCNNFTMSKSDNRTEYPGFVLSRVDPGVSGMEDVGCWTPVSGLRLNGPGVIFPVHAALSLAGRTLRVGVWEAPPFLNRLESGEGLRYDGLCVDMLQEIAYRLNFSYVLVEPADEQYGAPGENGTWNGMIAMLMQQELDMAAAPFTITSYREEVVDFTVPFMEDGGGILTKGDKPGYDFLVVFRPLPYTMWLCLGLAVFVTGTVLYVIGRVRSYFCTSDRLAKMDKWSMLDSFFYTYGSIVGQGAPRHPTSSAGRLVLGCWWLFTILIVSIYTATLAAMLTVTVQPDAIDSIDDLASASLTPITQLGTSWYTMFTTGDDDTGLYSTISTRVARAPALTLEKDILELVYKGEVAYISDVSAIDYLYRQDCNNLYMARDTFSVNGLGFALQQGSPYMDAVNTVILKLQEAGVMNVWRTRWWKSVGNCGPQGPSVSDARQLDIVSIGGILMAYGLVIVLAVLCLVLQRLVHSNTLRQVVHRFSTVNCARDS